MTEAQQKILEIIKEYTNKTLKEWCIVHLKSWKYSKILKEDIWNNEAYIQYEYDWSSSCHFNKKEITENLWHYDITAVLKYIMWNDFYIECISKIIIRDAWDDYIWDLPNKPLHLYSEQEEKDLLELLINLK